jgi:flavin-dependent dehydrogenase
MSPSQVDVAILGGGLAGNLLARQLRRTAPSLSVALFEKSTGTSYKVGESVVEIGSNYLTRRLGLTRYLYNHQLPKNGLRYFFDDPDCQTELHEMSEIGTVNLPFHPGFQIDRSRLEADLLTLNEQDGARVRRGARVGEIALGEGGAPHTFDVQDGERTTRWQARWLVDASGRSSLLARTHDLRVAEPTHRIGAVWGRFEGVADVDDLGPASFRERVRHTVRGLSTIHFWYPGYWIWFIPLRGGVVSVGLVGEPANREPAVRTAEGFRAFLMRHRAVSQLLEPAKLLDVGSYTQIAYATRRFFSHDRFALVGEAASAADPFYSPGTDFISLECDFLTDLVCRDTLGETESALRERCDLYDHFMQFRHEATLHLYRGLYGAMGSFELMCLKWDFDIGCYYNLWVQPYFRDEHLDAGFLRQQLRQRRFVLQALSGFSDLFRKAEEALRARGEYYRGNRGRFFHGLTNLDFMERTGLPRPRREILETTEELFNGVRARTLALLDDGAAREPRLPLTAFLTGRPLA